jgi:type I restriction-modification system DNA methylase subunit
MKSSDSPGGALGFEATLWSAAEKLKGNMDAGEYKHVVLGLIFLKYISDALEEKHAALLKDKSADAEDRDEYTADNIFWVNKIARWSYLQGRANGETGSYSSSIWPNRHGKSGNVRRRHARRSKRTFCSRNYNKRRKQQ